MLTFKNILVAHDFSSTSTKVLDYAVELAVEMNAGLNFLHVEVLHNIPQLPTLENKTKAQLLRERLKDDIYVSIDKQGFTLGNVRSIQYTVLQDVAAAPAIINFSKDYDIDLIVMGTHGRRGFGRKVLGSVAEEVVRMAPCPVLTVRDEIEAPSLLDTVHTIVVPVDFSEDSREALRYAKEMSALYQARIHMIHVIERRMRPAFYQTKMKEVYTAAEIEPVVYEQLNEMYESVEGPDIEVRFEVLYGHPVQEIVQYVDSLDTGIVVISTHGLTGLDRAVIGSVAERVVRLSPLPVITVKHNSNIRGLHSTLMETQLPNETA